MGINNEVGGALDVLVAGRPLFRNTTHLVVNVENGRLVSQHKSEKSAERDLRQRKGCAGFDQLKVLPVAAALANAGSAP